MPRKRTINPDGPIHNLSVVIPEPTYQRLKAEAAAQGISVGQLVRDRIAAK